MEFLGKYLYLEHNDVLEFHHMLRLFFFLKSYSWAVPVELLARHNLSCNDFIIQAKILGKNVEIFCFLFRNFVENQKTVAGSSRVLIHLARR